jgi:hypothetical protein
VFVGNVEGLYLRKFEVIVLVLLVMSFLMVDDVEGFSEGYVLAQGNPQETGELLPNPNLIIEPNVEIGQNSPEFRWTYYIPEQSLDLTWTHTPGYPISLGYGYPYQECDEYARMWQEFTWGYNQTPVTLKVSASVQISCTGDFATQENGDDMFEIGFWLGLPGSSTPIRIKSISDLSDGQSYDIEFLLSYYEAQTFFMGSIMYGGVQSHPSDVYRLYVGLIPTTEFAGVYGGIWEEPWEVYDGSVTATINHFSANALLEVESQAPPLIVPKFNTTSLWNDTSRGLGIEAMGQDSFVYLDMSSESYYNGQFSLGKMTSEHMPIWNQTISSEILYASPIMNMKVAGDSIFFLWGNQTGNGGNIVLGKFDSEGTSIWNKSVTIYNNDIPMFLDVASTGLMYLLSLSAKGTSTATMELVYSLIQLDSMGNQMWNETVHTMSYEEWLSMGYELQLAKGIGCSGGDVYLGMIDSILRYDSNGNQVWSRSYDFASFCNDPSGGFYTVTTFDDGGFELSRWNTAGSIVWTRSLSLDYGLEWRDYPDLQKMEVGPSRQLYLVLNYMHIEPTITVARVSISGDIISHDTIYSLAVLSPYFSLYYTLTPYITDMAITGNGLVHLTATNEYPSVPYYSQLIPVPADTLLTYELSGPISFSFTMSPESLIITGVATLILGGIAWDHFVRGRTRPEEILPVQEEIDPWEILMGDTEDK